MMRLGPLTLASNLFLSPLAGYTNLPFRLTVRELGGLGLATTDLVNARSLLEKKSKALKLIETSPADQPLAAPSAARAATPTFRPLAAMMGRMRSAQMSMTSFRARLIAIPLLMNAEESHPPPTLPTVVIM